MIRFVAATAALGLAQAQPTIETADIPLFWSTYAEVLDEADRAAKIQIVEDRYFARGTPGLEAIREARGYTAEDYVDAFEAYPRFWAAMRPLTLNRSSEVSGVADALGKLDAILDDPEPWEIYLTMGALRTNGTILDGKLLIGSELALATDEVPSDEFGKELSHLPAFIASNPRAGFVPLVLHEAVHLQQAQETQEPLLQQALYEGIAEFVSNQLLGAEPTQAAFAFEAANQRRVRGAFKAEMFSPWVYNWIWNSTDNDFGVRDLGYAIGYRMAEGLHEARGGDDEALASLLSIDTTSPAATWAAVEESGYFGRTNIANLAASYEKKRPKVVRIGGIREGRAVPPGELVLQVRFNKPLDRSFVSTDCADADCPQVERVAFDASGRMATYFLTVEPNKVYEMVIDSGFRTERGAPLVPYKVRFTTEG